VKFMITFNHIEGAWDRLSPEDRERHASWLRDFMAELESEKESRLVFLGPAKDAKTVRMHEDGTVDVSDGPYLEAREQPGGYYIIEADSMGEAVEWAKKGRFMVGSNQVRQIL
jgi:hypothetical protein